MVKERKILIVIVTLAMVASVDGKTTKGNMPDQSWASKEDKIHLSKLIGEAEVIIMGSNTYEVGKPHIKAKPGKLRLVLTRNPEKFISERVNKQLEFSSEEPESLINRLAKEGYENILLLSGHKLNKLFFEKNLIDRLILTIEPKVFGAGFGILDSVSLDINLKLKSFEKVNEKGTLILEYEVEK